MATTINEETTLTLIDGSSLSLRPLKLSLLRPFMKKFEKLSEVAEDNDKSIDALMDCVKIALQQYNPELLARTDLEEILDLPTVYRIVEAASGVNLTATDFINSTM
jgi:hypothetical protein